MMFCRAAWQRLAPLARKTLTPFSNAVFPTRQMSFGLPASGTNIAYVVLGGSSLTAALVYVCILYYVSVIIVIFTKTTVYLNFVSPRCFLLQAYKTINSDSARYNERIAQFEARPKIIPMSDLLSTVKILAGSTAEIAAASVGDQHLVATVRLAEENNSMETLNGLEVADVKAEVPAEVPERAVVEEAMRGRLNLKTEVKELEELPSSLHAVEENIVVEDDHVKSEADSPTVPESLASSEESLVTEMENILELEDSTSPVVMLSEDDTVSGAVELTSETVEEVGQKMEESTATETAHADLTAPPGDLEDSLQATAVESGNVAMTMTQA
ncbi:hypothetical protein cypCar_00028455 [Cyprinus carpio]|nr:hypothetical protein cypCar_00028455 [Cyprinus carpio]